MTRDEARERDRTDPLRHARDRFVLPPDTIYLDGNSLGALPRSTADRLGGVVRDQWGQDLIASWNRHDWIDWPQMVAARLSPLVGAGQDELIFADSTSICLFKLVAAAARARPGRGTILVRKGDFPTDHYVAGGLSALVPGLQVRAVDEGEFADSLGPDIAAALVSHVDYRSGSRMDMAAIEARAADEDCLIVWDLSHSAGAIGVDLNGCGARLAVGCGYKYLNGGPGAPAFCFVARDLQGVLANPLPGWLGHRAPFAFQPDYEPAPGMVRFLTGTPPILALAALDCGLATFDGIAMAEVERKGQDLAETFVARVREHCGSRLELASPSEPDRRGSHVVFAHAQGQAVMQALIARGVVGDFRAPDLIRFGFAPLYNGFEDVVAAADTLGEIIDTGAWDRPEYRRSAKVT